MKLQILSDPHFEHHMDGGVEFIKQMPVAADILIVAGDLTNKDGLEDVLHLLTSKWGAVIYVPGNHEYYGSTFDAVNERLREVEERVMDVRILNNDTCTIEGQRFVGTTLWFPEKKNSRKHEWMLGDFKYIQETSDKLYEQNLKAIEFLLENCQPGDVVITHHIPARRCTHERWRQQPINKYFVGDADEVIVTKQPRLWVFGHTHWPYRAKFHVTELVANPIGYPGGPSPWDPELVIEV